MLNVHAVIDAVKTISAQPSWVEDSNGRLWIAVPLEIDSITVESLFLRARVLKDAPDEDVFFQLEFDHDQNRRDKAISRIDWRPLHSHDNKGCGPQEWRFQAQKQSHFHKFDLNWLQMEGRLKASNLPIAVPLEIEPTDFQGLLAFVGKNFRISNIEIISQPGWEPVLL